MKSFAILFPIFLTIAGPAFGALGATEESVSTDQARFQATRTVATEHGSYRLHEMSRGDGSVIREYLNSAGTVFAVSWKGPVLPDLSQLLGTQFAAFRKGVEAGPKRRRMSVVHEGDLVVESSGHARGFYGRAYLSSMLPAGFTEEMVQ